MYTVLYTSKLRAKLSRVCACATAAYFPSLSTTLSRALLLFLYIYICNINFFFRPRLARIVVNEPKDEEKKKEWEEEECTGVSVGGAEGTGERERQ